MDAADSAPSRFVRQYALTRGRVRSTGADLELDTLVQSTARGRSTSAGLPGEQRTILQLTASPLSIAEISAHLHLHLGIARVLVSDLVADGLVLVSERSGGANGPDLPTLERLLDDLQAL
jgi:Protein of unknown function (DUF742)